MTGYPALTEKEIFQQQYMEQLSVVHEAACLYWGVDNDDLIEVLERFRVVKRTGGKMAGILAPYAGFPAAFLKVYFYERGFQFEVEGLTAASALPPFPGVRVPGIIRIIPEHKAILTELRTWQDTASPPRRFFVQSLNLDWRRLGKWLRQFHNSRTSQQPNDYFLRKKFEKAAAHMQALAPLFTKAQLDKMERIIEDARDYFKTEPVEWVLTHGDFALDNIKTNSDTFDIVDFEDCQMAPRAFDVINFVTRLEYTGYFPHSGKDHQNIRQEFLNGYGMELPGSPAEAFLYLLIKLDMLESYHRRRNQPSTHPLNRWIYKYFEQEGSKRLVKWLTAVK